MRSLSVLAVAGLMIGSVANAMVIKNLDRPLMGAKLTRVEPATPGFNPARGEYLTLNRLDGAVKPTSLTLTEDTGIRCFRAPCPSSKVTDFEITAVLPGFHSDVVRYEAVEVLRNIPPNVRIARRKLNLTESSMELVAPGGVGFMRRTLWDVEISSFPNQVQNYTGNPVALATAQDLE